jgi:hypothetical protein
MNPLGVSPRWLLSLGGDSAAAEVILDTPGAEPTEEPTTVLLRVYADGDGFRWSVYYEVPSEAPFNEGEVQWGSSADLELAKGDGWDSAVTFLRDLGYADQEIGDAVTAGSAR